MGFFYSKEEQDREAGEKCGREEREYREKHDFSFPINEIAGDIGVVGRGPEFQAARLAAREGGVYIPPHRSSDSESESSEPESNTSSRGDSYGSSGGGNYYTSSSHVDRRSGRSTDTSTGIGGLVGLLGVIIIGGAVYFSIFGNSNKVNPPQKPKPQVSYYVQQGTNSNLSLEENVRQFSNYLQENNQLLGNFNDYEIIIPPKTNPSLNNTDKEAEYEVTEVAFVCPHRFYTFHSSDNGKTWAPLPSSNPYFDKLGNYYVEEIRKNGKLSDDWLDNFEKRENQIILDKSEEKTKISNSKWDTSNLKPHRDAKAKLHWWLEDELSSNPESRKTLENLAEAVYKQTNGFETTIYDYSQKGQDLWAAGSYDGCGKERTYADGFICHSPDNGKNWIRQWYSKHETLEPVYGIYFSNPNEGWALTLRGILHTTDKGSSWNKVFESEYSPDNLFILSERSLLVTDTSPIYLYYSKNRGQSWKKTKFTPEYKKELEELKESFEKESVHYGGIYSKEETVKE